MNFLRNLMGATLASLLLLSVISFFSFCYYLIALVIFG
jgi:hypothetical protein